MCYGKGCGFLSAAVRVRHDNMAEGLCLSNRFHPPNVSACVPLSIHASAMSSMILNVSLCSIITQRNDREDFSKASSVRRRVTSPSSTQGPWEDVCRLQGGPLNSHSALLQGSHFWQTVFLSCGFWNFLSSCYVQSPPKHDNPNYS